MQKGAFEALLTTSRRVIEVTADLLPLFLEFSLVITLSLLGICRCRLLALDLRLRLSFRLGFAII